MFLLYALDREIIFIPGLENGEEDCESEGKEFIKNIASVVDDKMLRSLAIIQYCLLYIAEEFLLNILINS